PLPAALHRARPAGQGSLRLAGRIGRGPAGEHRRPEGARQQARPEDRGVRRARRRSLVHPFLPRGGARLRVLLALSRAHRPPGGGAGAAGPAHVGLMLHYFRCVDGRIEHFDEFRGELLTQHETAFHWIDLEDPTVKEATLLEDPFHFHPLAIEDCLSEVHHPKLDDYESYIFVIVHGVRFDAPNDQFITRELDIFLGKNYLI